MEGDWGGEGGWAGQLAEVFVKTARLKRKR